jgi:RNA polymerase sigma-70 factor (ECF subfamily)
LSRRGDPVTFVRVCPLPGLPENGFEPFHTTHWSVVLAAGESSGTDGGLTALSELCQTYWAPLYGVVRRRGFPVHDAQDLTQGFFAHLIEHRLYLRADQQRGPFRAFLLASLRNFLADAQDRAQALKRGGGYDFLPLHEEEAAAAENLFQTCHGTVHGATEDRQFERQWAEALVKAAFDRLAQDYRAAGKGPLFAALAVFVQGSGEPLPSYDTLADRLGIPAVTLRSHVTRLRERYREILRDEVRRTVGSAQAVDEELRELLRVLTSR